LSPHFSHGKYGEINVGLKEAIMKTIDVEKMRPICSGTHKTIRDHLAYHDPRYEISSRWYSLGYIGTKTRYTVDGTRCEICGNLVEGEVYELANEIICQECLEKNITKTSTYTISCLAAI
jgi:uncharacterized protein YxjI